MLFEAAIHRALRLPPTYSHYIRLIFLFLFSDGFISLRVFVYETLSVKKSTFEDCNFFCWWRFGEEALIILRDLVVIVSCHFYIYSSQLLLIIGEASDVGHNYLIELLNLTLLLHIDAAIACPAHWHTHIVMVVVKVVDLVVH